MAKPSLLFALAAIFLSLAAFSATALNLPNHNKPARAPHSGHSTHSAAKKMHAHHWAARTHRAPPPPPTVSGEGEVQPLEPYPGFNASVDGCLQKLSEVCGNEIFRGIIGVDDEATVSDGCCVDLVAMGRRCHREILMATVMLPELSRRERKEIKRMDEEIWSQCVLVSDALKYSPSPSAN